MNPDTLHRTAKILIDSGDADTEAAAMQQLEETCLHIDVEPSVLESRAGQACVATIANAASRVFLGGVTISGTTNVRAYAMAETQTVDELVRSLGAVPGAPRAEDALRIIVGRDRAPGTAGRLVWASAVGWTAAVSHEPRSFEPDAFPLAGIAAGAMAVAELLQHLLGHPLAGHRTIHRSLWDVAVPDEVGPPPGTALKFPADWWLVGLGHLGQGAIWSILHLPYGERGHLQLQDTDIVTKANLATGALVYEPDIDQPKTRVIAQRLERVGWKTTLVERRFDQHHRRTDADPGVMIVGVDNHRTRRQLDQPRVDLVIDLGLGSTPATYDGIAMRAFPGYRRADQVASWVEDVPTAHPDQPAYQSALAAGTLDHCGAVRLRGVAVGAACVGMFAGALAVAEAVRRTNQGPAFDHVDLHLRSTGIDVTRRGAIVPPRFRTVASLV